MYKKEDVLALESGILLIYTYYVCIQINFNTCLQNNTLDTLDVNKNFVKVFRKISLARRILFKLKKIKSARVIDYREVARRLYYLGSMSRKNKLHTDSMVWDETINIIKHSSFSAVFGHFISKLRKAETKFAKFRRKYQKVSFENTEEIQVNLLQLGSRLQELISYVAAVKIMLDFIKSEKIFETATRSETNTNIIETQKSKPVLKIVK